MVSKSLALTAVRWCHGVTVSTLDFESSDPSSNLGGTFTYPFLFKVDHIQEP